MRRSPVRSGSNANSKSSSSTSSASNKKRSLAEQLRNELNGVDQRKEEAKETMTATTAAAPSGSGDEKSASGLHHATPKKKKSTKKSHATDSPSGTGSSGGSGVPNISIDTASSTSSDITSTLSSSHIHSSSSSANFFGPMTPTKSFGLLKRPLHMTHTATPPGPQSTDPSKWTYIETPPAALIFDSSKPFTIISVVTFPRRRHQFKINLHVTVRQIYQHVKYLSGVTEAFDLLYSYPPRILTFPDATLADYQFDHISLLQRLVDDVISVGGGGGPHPPSKLNLEQQQQQSQSQLPTHGSPRNNNTNLKRMQSIATSSSTTERAAVTQQGAV